MSRTKKQALSGVFLLVTTLFLASVVSAAFTFSNPQLVPYTPPTSSFDNALCSQGQDFIVQISPAGCEPAIVRSDLLEEQDVEVYCPISATQINPAIDVRSINSVSFVGNYSEYVRSIGFYPAQAALNLQGEQNNYPLLSNVGYVLIKIKQIPNETAMPDFVTGDLTAKINYDADKVFGVGDANYYLPELSDENWESSYPEYEFWNGKGYLRLDNLEDGEATITVYDSSLNDIGTANLEQGETSDAFPISGFGFCSGGAEIKLNAVKNADTRARLDVNGDLVEAAKGEKFLENNCQIVDIQPQGLVRNVQVTCTTDAGKKTFPLKIAPQLTLEVEGTNRTVSLGDFLYTVPGEYNLETNLHGGKSVFLGYIGSTSVEPSLDTLFVVLVALPKTAVQSQSQLSNDELAAIAGWVQRGKVEPRSGLSGLLNALINAKNAVTGRVESVLRLVISGDAYAFASYNPAVREGIVGKDLSLQKLIDETKSVKVIGFAEGQDVRLTAQIKGYYDSAKSDYSTVQENYRSETYPSDSKTTLGEEALYENILLAYQLQQKFTLPVLCDDFHEKYPNSKLDDDREICKDVSLLASPTASTQYVSINGQDYVIGLRGVYSPTYEDYGAEITVQYPNGTIIPFEMVHNQIAVINSTSEDFMQLRELTPTTATVTGNVRAFVSNKAVLKEGEPAVFGNYVLTLEHVNLKQFAQVSVIPKTSTIGSSANFSFNIGIEKRLIQLNPEKTRERLAVLNRSLATWENVLNTTGKVIDGLQLACRITGEFLNAKSIISNLIGGEAGARQAVMSGIWNSKCADMVGEGDYISQDQCFLQNSDAIDKDVERYSDFIKQQNEEIKGIEQPHTTSSFLGGSVVNTDGFMQDYADNVQSSLNGISSVQNPENPSESISISEAKTLLEYSNWKNNNFRVSDARDIELYATILNSDADETLKSFAMQELFLTLKNIKTNSDAEILQETLGEDTGLGSDNVMTGTFQKKNEVAIINPKTFSSSKYPAANPGIGISSSSYAFGFKDSSDNTVYLIIYGQDGVVTGTYSIGAGNKLTAYARQGVAVVNPFNFFFKQYSEGSYKNAYRDPRVHYFETEPYKGMPAIVPVDVDEGWYAGLKQTLGVGNNIRTYDASARVNSFYLCNVGRNGAEEFNSGIGDDICQSMDLGSGSTYNTFPGISDESKVLALVSKARTAITDAARAYQSGVSRVVIDGRPFQVGVPAADVPNIQCQDFMSPKECNIMFNVCDPVICPSSRCDFGGAYPVKDVQQTGIIGSVLLCLPNAREGIAVPVCLSGIQTGAENLVSYQRAYADCLQEKLNSGKTVGICDELNSIYMCSLFWEQAAPLANLALPKITEALLGRQSSRGGGEYMSIQNAFDTAKQSSDYLRNYYGPESQQVFKLSTLNIGSSFCQNFASITVPSGAEILEQLSTPDSPPQFTGSFEEITLTTVTVPPTSQYKVSFHIYAGKNDGVYYSVYLQRTAGSSFYQDSSSTLSIDSGYIPAGGYADETIDQSASSGYDQLCINVNGQVECGFQQVSTSFAVNYLQDYYLATEVNKTDITKESDCRSGSPNIYSALNPNVNSAVGDVINPEIYNQGIIRTCATDNPGLGTDIHAGGEGSRWVEVGYCDSEQIKCWLDTGSVEKILDSPDLAAYFTNGTATSLADTTIDSVRGNYLSVLAEAGLVLSAEEFVSRVRDINSEGDSNRKIEMISGIMSKVFYNNQKAYLFLLRGGAYGKLATAAKDKEDLSKAATAPETTAGETGTSGTAGTGEAGTGTSTSTCLEICSKQTRTPGSKITEEFNNCMDNTVPIAGLMPAVDICNKQIADAYSKVQDEFTLCVENLVGEVGLVEAIDECSLSDEEEREIAFNACVNNLVGAGIIGLAEATEICTVQIPETFEQQIANAFTLCLENLSPSLGLTEAINQCNKLVADSNTLAKDSFTTCVDNLVGITGLMDAVELCREKTPFEKCMEDCTGKPYPPVTATTTTTSETQEFIKDVDSIYAAMNYAKGTAISNRKCNCGDSCFDYAGSLVRAGNEYNSDPLLLLSIMMQESECVASATNTVDPDAGTSGLAVGLMQIYSWEDCKEELDFLSKVALMGADNYDRNIKCGAIILRNKYNQFGSKQNTYTCGTVSATYTGWNAALRGYIGYGCTNNPAVDAVNYVTEVNTIYSTLKSYLDSIDVPQALFSPFQPETITFGSDTVTILPENSPEFASSTMIYNDGNALWGDLYYRFFNGEWHWSQDTDKWADTTGLPNRGEDNRNFIISLREKKTYSEGLNLLIERTVEEGNRKTIIGTRTADRPKLEAFYFVMDSDKEFTYYKDGKTAYVYFRFVEDTWEWKKVPVAGEPDLPDWLPAVELGEGFYAEGETHDEPIIDFIEYLKGKDFYQGARMMLMWEPADVSDKVQFEVQRPTAEDKKGAEKVCGYCSDIRSLGFMDCTLEECETRLGKEATEKYLMRCKFTPGDPFGSPGEDGIISPASCKAVTEAEYVPSVVKSYKIDRVGFSFLGGPAIYDSEVVRTVTISLVVDSEANCESVRYEVWKDALFDSKIGEGTTSSGISSLLNGIKVRGKYHVDAYCIDNAGTERKTVSKNLEVPQDGVATTSDEEKAQNVCSSCSAFAGGCSQVQCEGLSSAASTYGMKCQFSNGQCNAVNI